MVLDAGAFERKEPAGAHGSGVWSSLSQPPASQIQTHYAELWRIEQGFRMLKHTLLVRPVFHWTERRVRAHIALCYVVFVLLRILRWKHARQHAGQPPLSEDRILAELGNVTVSLFRDQGNGNRYLVPFGPTREQRLLYKTVDLKEGERDCPLFTHAVLAQDSALEHNIPMIFEKLSMGVMLLQLGKPQTPIPVDQP